MDKTAAVIGLREVEYSHPHAARLTDLAQAYYREIYGAPDSSPMDGNEFTSPRGAFFVGYVGADPVAMGGWRWHGVIQGFPARRPAELRRMFVHPGQRGRGFARTLLSLLEDSALSNGADATVLETGFPQFAAVRLYRSAGYVDIPPFGHYADEEASLHLGKLLLSCSRADLPAGGQPPSEHWTKASGAAAKRRPP